MKNILIKDTNLSVRCINCVHAADIRTTDDLKTHIERYGILDFVKFRHFGSKSIEELKAFVKESNLMGTEISENKKLSKEQLTIMSGIQETKRNWYISATEEIYTAYSGIRLTDAQLAKLLAKTYGGTIPSHTAKIRQTQCNAKWQEYVKKNL